MHAATSQLAYIQIKPELGERQRVVYEALRVRPMTNTEIATYLSAPINGITPRIFELRQKGLVVERTKRPCRVTGRLASEWMRVSGTLF